MCGEKCEMAASSKAMVGSPPRVRGKEVKNTGKICPDRITPACAGKRRKSKDENNRTEDHPRVCGEKTPSIMLPVSSGWITPACAGKRFFDIFGG